MDGNINSFRLRVFRKKRGSGFCVLFIFGFSITLTFINLFSDIVLKIHFITYNNLISNRY